jgi:ligand-binding sensor domain-containing protein
LDLIRHKALHKLFMRQFLLLFILICNTSFNGTKLNPTLPFFNNLTRQQGLIQSNIRAIATDPKGYIWMGSSDGLFKWDGLTLSIYRDQPKDSISLSDRNISALYPDPDSSGLWVGTVFGGLNYYYFSTGHFSSWLPPVNETSHGNYINNIKSICRINDSIMAVGTVAQGLFMFHFSNNQLVKTHRVEYEKTGLNYRVFSLKQINNKIYAGTSKGLLVFNKKGEIEFYSSGYTTDNQTEKWIKDFVLMPSGQLIFATNQTLWELDRQTYQATPLNINASFHEITTLTSDDESSLWIGTLNNGLFEIDLVLSDATQYTVAPNQPNKGLVHNQINDLLFYKHQPILMAATPAGISAIDFERILFKKYDLTQMTDTGNTSVFFVMQDSEESLWYWSLSGLYKKPPQEEKFSRILRTDYGMNQNMVRGGLETQDGSLWFATSNGLLKMHVSNNTKKWKQFEHQNIDPENLNNFKSIRTDNRGRIWLASPIGAVMYSPQKDEHTIFPFPIDAWGETTIPVTDIIVTDNDQDCWIGSKSPYFYHLDISSGEYKRIPVTIASSKNSKAQHKSNYILSMDTDNTERLWLATFGNGLLHYDKEKEIFKDDFAQSTLAGNTYAVRYGNDDHLWISTDYGITRLNPHSGSFNEFGLDEGAFCQEFNERTIYQTREGKLLMGGTNGFVSFNPENIQLNEYIPPVYISSYSVGNRNITIAGKNYKDMRDIHKKSITTAYGRHNISFIVSVLNFSNPAKNKISWKLEGFDKEWSVAPASHIISYSNIPPGTYRLKVKGANNHNLWNNNGDSLQIIVTAPFYEKTWFPYASGGVIILLIALIFWLRTRLLSRQKILLSSLVEKRTKNLLKAYK